MDDETFEGGKSPSVTLGGQAGVDDHNSDIFFSAIETTRMPMILTDPNQPDNPIVFANQAFLNMTGYAIAEIVGRNCRFLQGRKPTPKRLPKFVPRSKQRKRSLLKFSITARMVRRSGTRCSYPLSITRKGSWFISSRPSSMFPAGGMRNMRYASRRRWRPLGN